MPIEYLSENKLYINMDLAKQLGIEIPADLAEKAIDVKSLIDFYVFGKVTMGTLLALEGAVAQGYYMQL